MNPHVLIVDDSAHARFYLRRCVEATGLACVIREAANGREALAAIAAAPVEVVITGLVMPGMSGEELLLRLKMDPATAAVAVILVCSASNARRRDRLLRMGAREIFEMPVSPASLSAPLRSSLGQRKWIGWGSGGASEEQGSGA